MNWLCALCIHKLYFCIRFFVVKIAKAALFFRLSFTRCLTIISYAERILRYPFVPFRYFSFLSLVFFLSLFFYLSINTHFLSYFQQAMDFHLLCTICYCCALFYALVVVCSLLFKFCLSNLIHKPFHSIVNHVIYTYTLTLTLTHTHTQT